MPSKEFQNMKNTAALEKNNLPTYPSYILTVTVKIQ